jgi:hypothetical protein
MQTDQDGRRDRGQYRAHIEMSDHHSHRGSSARADRPPFETGELFAKGTIACLPQGNRSHPTRIARAPEVGNGGKPLIWL